MIDAFLLTVIQCAIFIGIPWIWYLIFCKEKPGFLRWIGLFKPKNNTWIKPAIIIFLVSAVLMAGPLLLFMNLGMISEEMLFALNFGNKQITFEVIIIILIKAIFQTSLSEEILFRGFIGKRFSKKFGTFYGNLIQAVLFGLPHGLPFILVYKSYVLGVTFFISAAVVGSLQFHLNEKKADGSIVPSFIVHSTMNIISFLQ